MLVSIGATWGMRNSLLGLHTLTSHKIRFYSYIKRTNLRDRMKATLVNARSIQVCAIC